MTIGLKMAEKRHFKKLNRQTTDRRTAPGLLIVGPELKVRIRQKWFWKVEIELEHIFESRKTSVQKEKKNVVYKQLLNNQASKMDYQQLDHIFSGEKMWYGKVPKELDHIYDGEKRWFSAFANN